MRKDELTKFAQELRDLEIKYGVEVCSDNYFTRAVIVDVRDKNGFSYHYKAGDINLDLNVYSENEDME
ncbi:hypothetical protein QGM71_02705 [Virgibacillus sp. C22-A2]|uniref:Uncharacterized protein n=1 Tax=Virgibacillus tibetensis TaxID=3042313 RepID=A0ABU6KBW0_9BACI|nr:hypothetical protein [Virgibacillus sp. C22-A2]